MNGFKDWSTRTKLMGAFVVVLSLMVFIGIFCVRKLGQLAASTEEITMNVLPSVKLLGEMRGAMKGYQLDLLSHVLSTSDDDMAKYDKRIAQTAAKMSKQFDDYATMIASEEGQILVDDKAQLEAERKSTAAYVASTEQVLRLSRKNENEVARNLALGPVHDLFESASVDLNRHIEWNQDWAARSGREATATYVSARTAIAFAIVLSLGLGMLLAILISRSILGSVNRVMGVLAEVGKGDLTSRLVVDGADEFGKMAASLNQSLDQLCSTLGNVDEIAVELSGSAQQLSSAAQQISSGAQEQAASLEETAASLEEIGSTVKQNADSAQHASQLAEGARDTAERGGRVVESAVSAMGEITKSSKKIADIITTIDEIAFQTNLLALNAAVEAARAGDQGRGFGVVAAEVRTLAQRTASAAKEIRALIADSSTKVEAGTGQVNQSGETLQEIVRSVKKVTDMVAEIAAASREQNTGVEQVNTAVSHVDQVTQANASQTEELSATAESLAGKAAQLQETLASFQFGKDTRSARSAPKAVRREVKPPPLRAARSGGRVRAEEHAAPKAANGKNALEEF